MSSKQNFEICKSKIEYVLSFKDKDFTRSDFDIYFQFTDISDEAQKIIKHWEKIDIPTLIELPDQNIQQLITQCDNLTTIFEKVFQFNPEIQNASNERNNIIRQFPNVINNAFTNVLSTITYTSSNKLNIEDIRYKANTALGHLNGSIDEVNKNIIKQQLEITELLSKAKDLSLEQGIVSQSIHFKNEFYEQNKLANNWLVAIVMISIIFLSFSFFNLFILKIDFFDFDFDSNIEVINFISSKVLIFIVLGYLLVLATKNYKSHKHNATVNKHRHNALLTYRSLVSAASEKSVGDIVLAHAAACIFSPQDSGFSSKGESLGSAKSVLELMTKTSSKAD